MNLSEATKLIAILKSVYVREKFTEESPAGFHWLLRDLPYDAVMKAAEIHGMRSEWCPTPADLRKILAEQVMTDITIGEATQLIQRQINGKGYARYAEWTFDDPAVAEAVAAIGPQRICLEDRSKGDYVTRDLEVALKAAQERRRRGVQDGTAAIGPSNVIALDRAAS